MKHLLLAALFLVGAPAFAQSESASDPVTTDPLTVDAEFPPSMHEMFFENEGSRLNGLLYVSGGPGPHPTVLLLHGFPGNERNLDLAQALRRAGANVLYFNYRGTWGSGGTFTSANALGDVVRAVELASDSAWAAEYRSDPTRVSVVGHSWGAFLGAIAMAEDDRVDCLAFLDGSDAGAMGLMARESPEMAAQGAGAFAADMVEGAPVDGDGAAMVADLVENAERYHVAGRAAALASRPVLVISASRANGQTVHEPLVSALRAAGSERLTEAVLDDDHSFSAHRIELARRIVEWQQSECWR